MTEKVHSRVGSAVHSILGNSPQKNRDFLLSVYGNYAIFAAE